MSIFEAMKCNTYHLKFDILQKPEKDLYKTIQANAKFKSLNDVVKTKVGINNFYNFSIAIKSSILMRDIILNCPYVSGWARSSQVLNDSDSKFDGYQFIHTNEDEEFMLRAELKELEKLGHSMDNMRCLIPLGTITDYAINIDLLTLVYLALVLHEFKVDTQATNTNIFMFEEVYYFYCEIANLLSEYGISVGEFGSMAKDANMDFNPINATGAFYKFEDNTKSCVLDLDVTYSVVGQLFRHRTLFKRYRPDCYLNLVRMSKQLTEKADLESIGIHKDIAEIVKADTAIAKNAYELMQGSIIPISITGTDAALHKALSQRICYINDTPHFKDAIEKFQEYRPDLKLVPPCKMLGKTCYVGYVNESRLKGEEKTQMHCPIWSYKNEIVNDEQLKNTLYADKTKWYFDNIPCYHDFLNNVTKGLNND
jgi:hypothetical protein